MKSSKWNDAKALFHESLDLTPVERQAFLSQNCVDQDLRREVEELLLNYEESDDFIKDSAIFEAGLLTLDESKVGEKIGNFEIVREIGRGGMGAVYLAIRADDEFNQQVALKIVKRGMDTDFIVNSFRTERQILASLNHPNIASLFEGGTTPDNLPYFVMEFVEGQDLITYCNQKGLDLDERLKLFRQVCSAVSYAHQNLVVHRDLKPSNILVTLEGIPKLLDFGIAKILNPTSNEADQTKTNGDFRLLTPEYASPEQIRGEKITTASDVYSLGVVLYQLLTGHSPYQTKSKNYDEIVWAVCETEPFVPSSVLSGQWSVVRETGENAKVTTDELQKDNANFQLPNPKSLKGDLDNIIIKALKKEPQRRYSSVQEFSEDIRRHLVGLPVEAMADTTFYRLSKFVKRHRLGVLAGVFMFLSLMMGISVATWQAIVARKERAKAEQRFNDVRKLTNSFLFEFHDAIQDLQGATPAREMTVKKALEYLDILAREQSNDSTLQFELASAYSKVADIQGAPGASNLGETAGAVASYRKAIEILETLVQSEPNNREFQKGLALNYKSIAYIYEMTGDLDLTLSSNQSALILFQNLVALDETDFTSKLELGDCYKSLGDTTASNGNLESALQNYRKTLEISESVLRSQPDNKAAKNMIMVASDAIGTTLGNPNFTNLGDTAGALQAHQRQLEICLEMLNADQTSQNLQATKAFTLKVIGEVQTARNEWKEAVASFKQSLEIQENLVKTDPKDAFAKSRLAYLLTNLGEALVNSNQLVNALKQHDRAIAMLEKLVEIDKENSSLRLFLNRAYQKKGDALVAFGQINEALIFYHKALKSNEEIAAQDLGNMDMRLQLANDYLQIARANVNLATQGADKKQEFWREARQRFEQSKEVFLEMQAHNLRTQPISDVLVQISQEIAKCDGHSIASK